MKLLLFLSILIISQIHSDELMTQSQAIFKAIPSSYKALNDLIDNPNNRLSKDKLKLGKMLFFEPRISKSGLISCATCHNLSLGGVDGLSTAVGHKWTKNPHHINSPTVYNAVLHKMQFWDGRSKDLEDQAKGPIEAGPEMAAPKELVVKRLKSMPEYVALFKKAFPKKPSIDFTNTANAIAAFERTLVTPSKFDDYLRGDDSALNKQEKLGLKKFMAKGCASCHNGVGIGGSMKQLFPIVKPYKYAHIGDFNDGKPGMVKVPGLRNIALTGPYFHNGAVWSLKEAVFIMGETQLGTTLSKEDVSDIVVFLKSLTGDMPKITLPKLPRYTNMTPKPEL
ncbi:MAG: cytochrome C biogenesis protein CcsA [Candidatus Cloacimonadota bacterium]|nr:MAG: cytochrome C biogenesis protein CcsA [Candidatus Cloacimonadota bacterium]PCJ20140.1 MAG: cytochrome C biogenesis protein CcsA [Candidatus Cloacimonadota bacterium]